jgi:hypothetical protein
MALNQTTFRSTLASIFSISQDYIIPKQGNWFNPQDIAVSYNKPDTWVAYKIDYGNPRVMPMLLPTDALNTAMASVSWYVGGAEIRFVGKRAEELAQSVTHWLHRTDVKDAFRLIDAELMADDGKYHVDSYYQDGLNTILAFRVSVKIGYSSIITTSQERWLPEGHTGLFITA